MTPRAHPPARVVGIGASAGGIDALCDVVSGLPAGLPHAICITLHLSASGSSYLPRILDRRCALPVLAATQGAPLQGGRVYVARPDHHLLVDRTTVRLSRGPKENGARPAVDAMLRSIAACHGTAGVAVVLSGALGDGSDGARLVLQAGGEVIVQDPAEALVRSMPERTIALVDGAATVLSAQEIGCALGDMPPNGRPPGEVMPVRNLERRDEPSRPEGPATGFTCPECNGAIWEVREGDVVVRYRCRIGHDYSEDAMVALQGSAVETALWAALEMLEERSELLRKVAERRGAEHEGLRRRFTSAADDVEGRAELLRRALDLGERDADAA